MNIVIGLLTAVLVVVCLLIVFIVLMQRPKQEGLGSAFGGGVTDQMFGAQTTNVLQKATVYLAVMFFGITIIMQVLIARKQSSLDGLGDNIAPAAPAALPATPGVDDISIPATTPIEVTPSPAPATPDENTTEPESTPTPEPAPATTTPEPTPASTTTEEVDPTPAPEPEPAEGGTAAEETTGDGN